MTALTGNLDLYGILQVDPRADQFVIQAAYHALARRFHPDQTQTDSTAPAMATLNRAYGVLRDPQQRREYDRTRAAPVQPMRGPSPLADRGLSGPGRTDRGTADRGSDRGAPLPFGRYEGWTLQQVARQDPDYLEWLRRHSSGVGYRRQIDEILATRRAAAKPIEAVSSRRW
jgi:curved DNA-binding protein CbpA